MSIIQKLQKISAEMFKQMLKTYQFKDVIVHKRASHLNVLEHCSFYPNKGIGFNIRRRTWPKGQRILLKQAHYKSNRFGHFIGLQYNADGTADNHPKRLQGINKRGVWEYELGDFESFTTDNGVTYTRADYEAYYKLRAPKNLPSQVEQVLEQNQEVEQQAEEQGVDVPEEGSSQKSQ